MLAALRADDRLARSLVAPGRAADGRPLALAWLRSPGLRLMTAHRVAHHFERPRPRSLHRLVPFLAAKVAVAAIRYAALVATKSDLAPGTPIDAGVALADGGYIIGGARHIGRGTVIGEHVTIGMDMRHELKPIIGQDVWISPRCITYGDIRLGDGATLLPRTVLSRSVPPGAVVEGNPGRVVGILADHTALRRRLNESTVVSAADFLPRAT